MARSLAAWAAGVGQRNPALVPDAVTKAAREPVVRVLLAEAVPAGGRLALLGSTAFEIGG